MIPIRSRAVLVGLLAVGLCAALVAEVIWWDGGLIRLPVPLMEGVVVPVPLLYWVSVALYSWSFSVFFDRSLCERWRWAIRLGLSLHLLGLFASFVWHLRHDPGVATFSPWYVRYCLALWGGVLTAGMVAGSRLLARWRRRGGEDPSLFFLPLVWGYAALWAVSLVVARRFTICATLLGLVGTVMASTRIVKAWSARIRTVIASERVFLAVVFLVALAFRLFYTTRVMSNPDFLNTGSDGPAYDALAWALIHGGETPWSGIPLFAPGYVRFLALIYWLGGRSYFLVCAVQSVIGALTCLLMYDVAKRLFGRTVARIAAAFGALDFLMIFSAAAIGHQAIDPFWTLLVVWCLLRYVGDPRRWGRWIVGIGGLLGWAAVTREGNIIFWFFLIGWFLLGMRAKLGWRRVLLHVSGLSLGFLVVLLPFLWEGGGEGGGGMVDRIAYIWFFYQHTATPINTWFNPWQNPEAAWTLFQGQPLTIVAKVGEAMLGNFTAMFLHQGYGSFDPVFLVRGSPYYDGMWFYALSLALVGLGVVCWGAFRRPREHVDWWLIIVLLASRTGVHLVLASAYRYRAPLEPYLIMLAAVGVTQLVHSLDANWAGGRRLRHATRPA